MRRRSWHSIKRKPCLQSAKRPTWTYFLEKLFVKIHSQNKDMPIVLWMAYQSS